jgi:hypothetical protein
VVGAEGLDDEVGRGRARGRRIGSCAVLERRENGLKRVAVRVAVARVLGKAMTDRGWQSASSGSGEWLADRTTYNVAGG